MPNSVEIVGTYRATPPTVSEGPAQVSTDDQGRLLVKSPASYSATATILSGASLSGTITLGSARLVGIIIPAAWTTASISLQGGMTSGGTYYDIYDNFGTAYTIVVGGTSRLVQVPIGDIGYPYIKLQSGVPGALVVQGADRTLTAILQP